jgi:hypothetical protein
MQYMGAAITEFCPGALLKPVLLCRVGRGIGFQPMIN